MIGVVVALEKEAHNFIKSTNAQENSSKIGKKIFTGSILGKDFVLIISGIGKVNAALSTQYLLDNYSLDFILNFGSVGGIFGKTNACSYYLVDKCCQYDFDLSELDDVSVGYIQDYDSVYFSTKTDKFDYLPIKSLATSDRFTSKQSDIETVLSLGCDIFDMEGGAIAEVCAANGIPLYIVKGVTDTHGSGNDTETFYKNLNAVCDGFYDIIVKGLK